ncbi:MAG: TFIIB-type zinc ribbon-containing protein [Promethearchaeota archaeon]
MIESKITTKNKNERIAEKENQNNEKNEFKEIKSEKIKSEKIKSEKIKSEKIKSENIEQESNTLLCTECNGTDFALDNMGYLVCKNCGAQLTEYGKQELNKPSNEIKLHFSHYPDPIKKGTHIGMPTERMNTKYDKLSLINLRFGSNYKENVFAYAYKELKRICGNLELSHKVSDFLFEVFKRIWINASEFKNKEIRSPDKLIPIVIYRGVRYLGVFIKINRILEYTTINIKKFKEIFIRTYVLFPTMDKSRRIRQYIGYIMKSIDLGEKYNAEVLDFAVRVFNANRLALMTTSDKLSATTSIVISILCNMPQDIMPAPFSIAKIAEISPAALTSRIRRVLKYKNINLKGMWEYKKELYKYKDVLLRKPSEHIF